MDSKQFMIPKTSTLSRRKVIMIRIVLLVLFVIWVAGAIYLYLDVRDSSKKLKEIKQEAQRQEEMLRREMAYQQAIMEQQAGMSSVQNAVDAFVQ